MSESRSPASRRDEIATALTATRERIAAACAAAGRSPQDVTLIVVTKFHPADDIVLLGELGVRDIGENRHQEAEAKLADLAEVLPAGQPRPTMHFIGQAQRNKAAAIARYADVVHSVDRDRLAVALDRGAERAGRRLDVLLQVDLDPEPDPGRGGVLPADVASLADAVAALEHLRLRGVMTVAPLGMDPEAAFAALADVVDRLRSAHPEATWVSAGMSGDLEAAVAYGATHLRVGTAILGSRPPHR
ncbi:MAG TPA: YggS family pyridoxal phosphate-dependent enzyme [Intrasporangiaceae bacterium]|nr:YggS family pyridoxal phosphate-dependent enzyme [Intrasporangiaceae bacterium]